VCGVVQAACQLSYNGDEAQHLPQRSNERGTNTDVTLAIDNIRSHSPEPVILDDSETATDAERDLMSDSLVTDRYLL